MDATGNIVLAGSFMGTADFDPGAGTTNLVSIGVQDAFVSKYSSTGALVWARQIGAASSSLQSFSLGIDTADNVYSTGSFQNSVDFDPGPGTSTITATGGFDAYVWKLTSVGNFVWGRALGGSGADVGNGVAVDAAQNVVVVGNFANTIDFDPGVGTVSATSAGGQDAFVWKLNQSGSLEWGRALGGIGGETGTGTHVDSTGSAYVAGSFQATVDFDPSPDTANVTVAGDQDSFVWKLDTVGFAATPTTSTSSTPTVAPTTTLVPAPTVASTVAPTVAPTTAPAVNVSGASATPTTVRAPGSTQQTGLPSTGSSVPSTILWSGFVVLLGVMLQLRVNHVLRTVSARRPRAGK